MVGLEVDALPTVCKKYELQWFHLPIEDDEAPAAEYQQKWDSQKQQIHNILEQNGTLVIHCRGGSGRTGLMAAIILMERGTDFDRAVSTVKGLRPKALMKQPHIDYLNRTYGSQEQRS